MPATRVATTGRPAPIASTSDSGRPSQSDGITKRSIAASRLPRSRRAPRKCTRAAQAERVDAPLAGRRAARRRRRRSGAAPPAPACCAIASNRTRCAFCSVSRAMMPATGASGRHAESTRASRRGVIVVSQLRPVDGVVDHVAPLSGSAPTCVDVEVAHRFGRGDHGVGAAHQPALGERVERPLAARRC